MQLVPSIFEGKNYFLIDEMCVRFGVSRGFFSQLTSKYPHLLGDRYFRKFRSKLAMSSHHLSQEFYDRFFPVYKELDNHHVSHSHTGGRLRDKFTKKVVEILECDRAACNSGDQFDLKWAEKEASLLIEEAMDLVERAAFLRDGLKMMK